MKVLVDEVDELPKAEMPTFRDAASLEGGIFPEEKKTTQCQVYYFTHLQACPSVRSMRSLCFTALWPHSPAILLVLVPWCRVLWALLSQPELSPMSVPHHPCFCGSHHWQRLAVSASRLVDQPTQGLASAQSTHRSGDKVSVHSGQQEMPLCILSFCVNLGRGVPTSKNAGSHGHSGFTVVRGCYSVFLRASYILVASSSQEQPHVPRFITVNVSFGSEVQQSPFE